MHLNNSIQQLFCGMLKELQLFMLQSILDERKSRTLDELSSVSEETAADTIYAIDKVAEHAIRIWFASHWPADWPVEIVMEGLEDEKSLIFPRNVPVQQTRLKCIIDPIDGTRGIMYDKRAAWILCGLAPQKFESNTLMDIEIAVMTEIPTTRQWRADCISAVRGFGIESHAINILDGMSIKKTVMRPSSLSDVRHGFGTVARFFPPGLTLLSQFEESLWDSLYGTPKTPSPIIFNDQYISTGGQFFEILAGHDRFIADIRPEAFRKLGIEANLCCHPYDVATSLILEEAGCIVEKPDGNPLDCPLDTTTPVSWVAYANEKLAEAIRPVFKETIARVFS